jgi:excisionase family DNA binding protein
MTTINAWPALMSTALAARYLDTSERTVRDLARDGDLPQTRLTPNGHPKYSRDDLDALVTRRKKATA